VDSSGVEFAQLVENGGFEEAVPADALGAFWLGSSGRGRVGIPTQLVTESAARSGTYGIEIQDRDATVYQFIPALEELSDRMTVSAFVYVGARGGTSSAATLTVRDSQGCEVVYVLSERPRVPTDDETHAYIGVPVSANGWTQVELDYGTDYVDRFGPNPLPRRTLLLGRHDAGTLPVFWDDVEAQVAFRQMSERELADAILDETRWVIENLTEHMKDDINLPSPYYVKVVDAMTGEVLNVGFSGGGGPVYAKMLAYLEVRDDPEYIFRRRPEPRLASDDRLHLREDDRRV
jgi:hypothetical protein